jgi:uncharacterized protein YjbJ (UPF0337 family)
LRQNSSSPVIRRGTPVACRAGKVTGDKELQAEGKFDKAKGAAHNGAGDVKDAFRNATKP